MTNDRFKYRIYDVENKKYVDNPEDFVPWDLPDGLIAEQCTGLTDKNGVLIFEGDVVSRWWNDRKGVVEYGEFNCTCCDGVYGWWFNNDEDIRNYEDYIVVGNIHESGDK